MRFFKEMTNSFRQRERELSNRAFRDDLRVALSREANHGWTVSGQSIDADRLWAKIERGFSKEEKATIFHLPKRLPLSLALAAAMALLGTIAAFQFLSNGEKPAASFAQSLEWALEQESDTDSSFPLSQNSTFPQTLKRGEIDHCNPNTQSCLVQNFL